VPGRKERGGQAPDRDIDILARKIDIVMGGADPEVELTRDEAKRLKIQINTQRIYPPTGERVAILAAAALDAGSGGKSLQDEFRTYSVE
jgi:hypothetical protein